MKLLIPALQRVADAAAKHAATDPDLHSALEELRLTEEENAAARKQALEMRGIDCVVCGRRFLPMFVSYSACCSIGCQLSDPPVAGETR